jgi:Fe-S-cluster containining protein
MKAAPVREDDGWRRLERLDRRYPARADAQQPPRDAQSVCSRCLGGTCCTTEGPIALTAHDLLRLSAALDLSPAEFMRLFTQDRFDGPDGERYRQWLADPNSSVVSFVRRRTLDAASACIFLVYIHEADGTPRRVCSVHPARPLACREYYHAHCQGRWTGELAVLQAIGYERLRDGELDARTIEREWLACGERRPGEPLSTAWRRAFWAELRRARQPGRANGEGAAEPTLVEQQDALDDKIDRLLSTQRLRFEEKYGVHPVAEQLQTFDAGLSLAGDVRRRLLDIATRVAPARARLHGGDGLAWHMGARELLASGRARAADELLVLQRRLRRGQGPAMEIEVPLALHLALAVALHRQLCSPGADARLRRAWAWQAEAARALGEQALPAQPAEACTALATLAAFGHSEAQQTLSDWLRSRAGRALRHAVAGRLAAAAHRWREAPALATLVLVERCVGAQASAALLARLWVPGRLRRLGDDALIALADHSLRCAGFDRAWMRDSLPRLATALGPAGAASIWDAGTDSVADLWHDRYVLRAIDRAGLRAVLAL